jgi:outer membrane protein assembly factor BamB
VNVERFIKVVRVSLTLVLTVLTFPSPVSAESWPTSGHDAGRGGQTAETIPFPVKPCWTHQPAQAPCPAWADGPAPTDYWNFGHPLLNSSDFDHAFHVAVADGRLFYGSSADDAVRCLDAATGVERWRFVTGGPIRLAPTVCDNRVLAASDDGCVYALDAASGRLLWTYMAARGPKRLPGNQRLISLWPVRCGIAVADDTAYVAAGVFPSDGAVLCAIRLKDGTEEWRCDIDVCPQGSLAVTGDLLVVPTGRTAPALYDRRSGKLRTKLDGTGSTHAAAFPDMIAYGPNERGEITLCDPADGKKLIALKGRRLTVAGEWLFVLDQSDLSAYRRNEYLGVARQLAALKKGEEAKKKELQKQLDGCRTWRTKLVAPNALILAGKTLIAGGDGRLETVDSATGEKRGTIEFKGSARGLAVAGGRLYVSTAEGPIHCFSAANASGPSTATPIMSSASASPANAEDLMAKVGAVRKTMGETSGYLLVLGDDEGRLALEIARATKLHAVALASSEDRAQAARQRLLGSGLYGRRVAVLSVPGETLPFPDGFANAITSLAFHKQGEVEVSADEIRRVLRPCGGTLILSGSAQAGGTLAAWWGGSAGKGGLESAEAGTWVYRRPSLEGAGRWTHALADPGNNACSGDVFTSGPMQLQWFGPPGPARMPDRHHRNVPPLYRDGRLFIAGNGTVWAVDAYNGCLQWQAEIPGAIRMGAFLDSSHTVVDEKFLYVAVGDECLRLDVASGARAPALKLPGSAQGAAREWGHLSWEGPMLYGSARAAKSAYTEQSRAVDAILWNLNMKLVWSDALFGIERDSGKEAWTYRSALIANTTIAAGDGRVYFVEAGHAGKAAAPMTFPLKQILKDGPANLVALDGTTGRVLYRKPIEGVAIEEVIYLNASAGKLFLSGGKSAGKTMQYSFQALDAATGQVLWNGTHPTDLPSTGEHGEQNRHPTIVSGTVYLWPFAYDLQTGKRIETWQMDRHGHGCGGEAASQNALFWRGGNPWMQDLGPGGEPRKLTTVTRPGCWINILPAGGLVLIPEASSGCTCGYTLQTSMALAPRAGWSRPKRATSNPLPK